MNTATHCAECSKPLDKNKYIQSPDGGICKYRAWCPTCYETLHKVKITRRIATCAARPSPKWEDGEKTDDDEEY